MEAKKNNIKLNFQQNSELTLIVLIIILGLVLFLIDSDFFILGNIKSIIRSFVPYFIIGCGMTLIIITKNLDLSVGSVAGLSSIVVGYLINIGLPIFIAILLTILVGIFIGTVNGLLISYLKWPSLIVTLGMLYVVMGISLVTTGGDYVTGLSKSFTRIGQIEFFNIPLIVIVAIVIGIFFYILLEFTKFGYSIKSIGGNEDAALSVGIRVNRLKLTIFMLSGVCSSIAGVILASRVNVGAYSIGTGYELYAIATVIIGGTSLYGGVGTIIGTFLGAIFLSFVSNGLMIAGVDPYWQNMFVGIILLIAVGVDTYRRNKMWQIAK